MTLFQGCSLTEMPQKLERDDNSVLIWELLLFLKEMSYMYRQNQHQKKNEES